MALRPSLARPTAFLASYTARYALVGVLFGTVFPLGSTVLDASLRYGGVSLAELVLAQRSSPLHWVIDTAPLFLGLFAALAGRRQDALSRAMGRIERANRALEEANEELRRAGKLKSQFLANMSHELRTPLNAIIGFSRIVLRKTRDVIPEQQAKNLEMVHDSGQHLLAIVNDLLDIERIEAGILKVSSAQVSVSELTADVIARLRPAAAEKSIELFVHNQLPELVLDTDPQRLRQILDNLVNNAIKYSDRGRVVLSVARNAGSGALELAVTDQGVGIAESELERIFEAFHQVDGSATRAQGGVGLGLHLVRKLATMLGASVDVTSVLGKGSTFTLTLPEGAVLLPERERIPSSPPPARGAGPLVLIIDDQEASAEVMQTELVDHGFRVHIALSGKDGLERAKKLHPDAIVLDIVMPAMDGWEVLRELRSTPELASTPVIVASVLNDVPLAYDLGIRAWLTKPLSAAAFSKVFDSSKHFSDVLVIEDDGATQSLIRHELAELSIQARVASDEASALAAFEDRVPSAVVLDLMLPGSDGFQVLRKLRQAAQGGEVPVVVYTAKEVDDETRDKLNGGIIEIISKGEADGLATVVSSVARAMARSEAR